MGHIYPLARGNRRLMTAAAAVLIVAAMATMHLADRVAASPADEPELVQVSSTTLRPGQTLQSYHMTVTNRGATTDVVVPAPVPAEAVADSSTDRGSYADGQWYIGVLESGETATLDLTAEN